MELEIRPATDREEEILREKAKGKAREPKDHPHDGQIIEILKNGSSAVLTFKGEYRYWDASSFARNLRNRLAKQSIKIGISDLSERKNPESDAIIGITKI